MNLAREEHIRARHDGWQDYEADRMVKSENAMLLALIEFANIVTHRMKGLIDRGWDAATDEQRTIRVNAQTELNNAYLELEDALYKVIEAKRLGGGEDG